jgi:hypothetical protein
MLSEASLAEIAVKHGVIKENVQGRATELASMVFYGSEVCAGAWACGWANGRWAKPGTDHFAIGRAPVDLSVGALGLLASAFDMFGPMNMHVAHISMGAAASYWARVGQRQGETSRAVAHVATAPRRQVTGAKVHHLGPVPRTRPEPSPAVVTVHAQAPAPAAAPPPRPPPPPPPPDPYAWAR